MSELLLLGVSHHTAGVALRERLALTPHRGEAFLRALRGEPAVEEAVLISTCNRTELYLVGDPVPVETAALGALARQAGIRPTELAPSMYVHRNCDAARQLFRVCAGLDSMIVGEAEVQGQVRRAWEAAGAAGTTGQLTDHLFAAALAGGGRVRSETQLGAGALSVASVAVSLAREALGGLAGRQVVVLGAGETSELAAARLHEHGVGTLFVANRRHHRALELARRFAGRATSFDELPEALAAADILVSATASPHAILGAEELWDVMAARGGRPLLLVDLAVPRDVDPECREIPGVTLWDVDHLQSVVARNRSVREGEARHAEAILEEETARFAAWLASLEVLPTIAALRTRGDEVVRGALAENEGRWEGLTERDAERLEAMARAIANRLLHEPTLRLKRTEGERAHAHTQVLRELFGLEDVPQPAPPSARRR